MAKACSKCGHTSCKGSTCGHKSCSCNKAAPSSSKCPNCGHKHCQCSQPMERSSSAEKSDGSRGSRNSGKSHDSAATATSGKSDMSVLAKTISEDLHDAMDTLETILNNWAIWEQNIDQWILSYDKQKWTKEMRNEHKVYHSYDQKRKDDQKAFKKHYKDHCRHNPSVAELQTLRSLAITWADHAVKTVELRGQFLINYPTAYPRESVAGHIAEAQNTGRNARAALDRVKQTKDNITALKG